VEVEDFGDIMAHRKCCLMSIWWHKVMACKDVMAK
jgi:hypothetical protein